MNIDKNTSNILRVTRKAFGLTQGDIVQRFNCSSFAKTHINQSAISKMEGHVADVPTRLFFWLAKEFKFNPEYSSSSGFVEFESTETDRPDGYKISPQWIDEACYSVKYIAPILTRISSHELRIWCKRNKFDPDYFYVLNNSINIRLFIELMKLAPKESILEGNLEYLPYFHGIQYQDLKSSLNGPSAVRKLVTLYQDYNSLVFPRITDSSRKSVELELINESRKTNCELLWDYNLQYFKNFSESVGHHSEFQILSNVPSQRAVIRITA